jgi:hypothetical protein
MLKYKCNRCKKTRELTKATLEIKDNKIRTREAKCSCGDYMQEIEKDFDGFPGLIRTEPSLRKK